MLGCCVVVGSKRLSVRVLWAGLLWFLSVWFLGRHNVELLDRRRVGCGGGVFSGCWGGEVLGRWNDEVLRSWDFTMSRCDVVEKLRRCAVAVLCDRVSG